MTKVILKASIGIKDGYPFITLQDEPGTTMIGTCLYNSIESLARDYQMQNEYRNKETYEYYCIMEGTTEEIKLFQRPVLQIYGEPTLLVDETNKH